MPKSIFASHGVLPLEFKPPHSMQSPARDIGSSFLRNAFSPCEDRRLGAVGQMQLAHNVAFRAFYHIHSYHQLRGNLTVAVSGGDEP